MSEEEKDHPILVDCCRECKSKYIFRLDNDEPITVLCGRPQKDAIYKATSYAWEAERPQPTVPLQCRSCNTVKRIPMRDTNKLSSLLNAARGDVPIWVDAMSIDQDDENDRKLQLSVMGDIYRHAQMVSVLLPTADEEAFEILKQLAITADIVVKRHGDFGMLADIEHMENSPPLIDANLIDLADSFLAQLTVWTDSVSRFKYWQRAWTFQEWTMARELAVWCESPSQSRGLINIKNVIVMAATIIVHWKVHKMNHPEVAESDRLANSIRLRDQYGKYLDLAKAHFPFEDFLVGDDDESPELTRQLTFMPRMPIATSSGTSILLESRKNTSVQFRTMLSLALNALRDRACETTYEADKIACWASMCNIEYDYQNSDTYAVALHKVMTEIRRRGIKVYNWLANTTTAETDLKFVHYAAVHRQTNSANRGFLVGTPAFIGRADTVTHLRHSLGQDGTFTLLEASLGLTLRQVDKVIIKRPIPWSNKSKALQVFRSMVSGRADGERLFDVGNVVEEMLNGLEDEVLNQNLLVTVSIGVEDFNTMWYFNAWATCPRNIDLKDLVIARESLNGTLVLATYQGDRPAKEAQIVAYLTTTHQRDGTYLLQVDETGVVDIVFRTADTPQNELFWLPEEFEAQLGGPHGPGEWNVLDDIRDHVSNMKISLMDRTFVMPNAI